jgi:hypothetical protein
LEVEKMSIVASKTRNLGFCAVAAVLLSGVAAVQAQDLSVSPTGWDYGSVLVGNSETVTFNLAAGPPTAVWVYQVVLNDALDFDPPCANPFRWPDDERTYSFGAFSFGAITFLDAYQGLPREMPNGDLVTVDVIFTPPDPGYYSVFFGVHSNDSIDPPGMYAFFLLEGTGVAAVPVPGALLLAGLGAGIVTMVRRRTA